MELSLVQDHLYIDWQGEGPPLLLLHGWGMNGAVWQEVAPQLVALGFRVGTVDLPGFGYSAALTAPKLTDWVACLCEKLTELGQPVHLLGWSLGGVLAMKTALIARHQVASLVTIASSPCFPMQDNWPGIKPQVLQHFATQLLNNYHKTLQGFFALQTMGSEKAREEVRILKQAVMSRPMADQQTLIASLMMLMETDLRADLPQITAPWLRIYGRLDALVPARTQILLDELVPNSQSIVLDKASHAPFISHLEQTTKRLAEFYQTSQINRRSQLT